MERIVPDRDQLAGPSGEVPRLARFCADTIAEPCLWWYPGGEVWHLNPAASQLLGQSWGESQGLDITLQLEPAGWNWHQVCQQARNGRDQRFEARLRRAEGDSIEVQVRVSCFQIDAGEYWCALLRPAAGPAAQRDLDPLHDPVTLLPNRALFLDRLQQAIEWTRRTPDRAFALMLLDLDRFQLVNESLGHAAGNTLLRGVGRILTRELRATDTLGHFGGDRFAMVLEEVATPDSAVRVADRIHTRLSAPFLLDDREVFATASLGVAFHREGGSGAEQLVHDAETALARAKMLGGDRHVLFDGAMQQRAVERLRLETELHRAVDRREFELDYQPILRLGSRQLLGFEALLRWRHPERGRLLPAEFLALAEETGLTIPIGEQVLEQLSERVAIWRRGTTGDLPYLSFNLSPRQFQRDDLVAWIEGFLASSDLPPASLALELTEGIVMEGDPQALRRVESLRALGVRLFLDDFGTGYSSLSVLHQLPFDNVKIDRSFIARMNGNSGMVRAIAGLCHDLGLGVVAEGIETEEQEDTLTQLGCEYGQGFHLSVPLPALEADNWVRA